MKKMMLSLGVAICFTAPSFGQEKKTADAQKITKEVEISKSSEAATPNPDAVKFATEVHDFGTIPEGPSAEYEFTFTNVGTEPIVIQRAQPSCGCTTPSYSKDPILPGKEGAIKAAYATQGRPNAFTKTITVYTNVGTKVLTIKGNVEKAPDNSVPQNTSMIKTR